MRMSPRTGPPPRNTGRSHPRAAGGLQREAIGCCRVSCPSPIRRVERDVLGDLAFPAVAVRKQALLVEVKLLAGLGRELEVWAFDDGVHRAGLLAKAAVDAFDHIDVVARGAAGAVVAARSGLDRDGLRRADRLAEFTGDAAFLAVGIAAQRVLAAKARRNRPLLERIVERGLRLEEVTHGEQEARYELLQKKRAGGPVQPHGAILSGSTSCRPLSLSPRSSGRASSRGRPGQ